jgi:S1-C subfamily serine protease
MRSRFSLILVLILSVCLPGAIGVRAHHATSTTSVAQTGDAKKPSGDLDDAIRNATGLRFRVIESVIRRNIISTSTPYGYKIRSVDADSPAARAGLKKGDVLLTWDGQPIKSRKDLRNWIDAAEANAEIPIHYARLKANRNALDRHPWQEHEGVITPVK